MPLGLFEISALTATNDRAVPTSLSSSLSRRRHPSPSGGEGRLVGLKRRVAAIPVARVRQATPLVARADWRRSLRSAHARRSPVSDEGLLGGALVVLERSSPLPIQLFRSGLERHRPSQPARAPNMHRSRRLERRSRPSDAGPCCARVVGRWLARIGPAGRIQRQAVRFLIHVSWHARRVTTGLVHLAGHALPPSCRVGSIGGGPPLAGHTSSQDRSRPYMAVPARRFTPAGACDSLGSRRRHSMGATGSPNKRGGVQPRQRLACHLSEPRSPGAVHQPWTARHGRTKQRDCRSPACRRTIQAPSPCSVYLLELLARLGVSHPR